MWIFDIRMFISDNAEILFWRFLCFVYNISNIVNLNFPEIYTSYIYKAVLSTAVFANNRI